MVEIPAQFLDLMTHRKALAQLATIMPDGSPQVTPVWFDYADGLIRVNTVRGRVKARNMREGARVALCILDPENDGRYVQIRGHVARATEEHAVAHIDLLARKYMDLDSNPYARPGEVRVIFEIAPDAVQGMS